MKRNLLLAKEIFFKYYGSHFFMSRDNNYEYYKSFNITREQEEEWIKEILNNNIEIIRSGILLPMDMKNKFCNILSLIRTYKYYESFCEMSVAYSNVSEKLDSFSKIVIAENVLDTMMSITVGEDRKQNNTIGQMRIFALDILKDVINKPVIVDKEYLKINNLHDAIKEDAIIKRALTNLAKWE